MRIVVKATEEVWKYNDDYFLYPICLPNLKLLEKLQTHFQSKITFISHDHTVSLINDLTKAYGLKLDYELVSDKILDRDSLFLDLNSPLMFYKASEIIKAIENKQISKLTKIREFSFRIRTLEDIEKLYKQVKKLSKRFSGNVYLGDNIFICPLSSIGKDNVLFDNVVIINSIIGNSNRIGPNVMIYDSVIADNNKLLISFVRKNKLMDCNIGPFSHLREGNILKDSKIGAFVECKNVNAEGNLKASHLAYLGDLIIGKNVNIGAGVVFANYDGKTKYTSIVKDNSFIGSNAVIISPKVIGPNSYVGAGTVVTKDVPENTVVVGNPSRIHKQL
ncbi:MAG: DapH/DapD/GlmU-related protein [bacterium]